MVADGLSRVRVNAVRQLPGGDDIQLAQRRDAAVNNIIQYWLAEQLPSGVKSHLPNGKGRYCLPRQLLSDRGMNYISTLLQEVNRLLEVKHKRTTAYHPATNGQSERIIKVIKYCLAQTVNSTHTDWDQQLPFIRMAINQSWHATTNSSSALLWFDQQMMTPTRMLLPGKKEPMAREGVYPAMMEQKMTDMWSATRAYMKIAKGAQKFYYDHKVVAATIDVGDRVYKYVPSGKPGLATKLVRKWIGPYIVVRKAEEVAWIQSIQKPHREPESVHLNMLKKYLGVNVPPDRKSDG